MAKKKRGRPPKFATPEEFDAAVDKYLENLGDKPVSLTGMLLSMGIYCKNTFYSYEKKDGFSIPVKRARAIVENAYEERLHGNSPTGAIFALKNMGWTDKQEREITGKDGAPLGITVEFVE
jgi:hypothetical protein